MAKHLTADDILPLVACLTSQERIRLLRLIKPARGSEDRDIYRVLPAAAAEFSTDDEPLSWDAEGWENLG